MLPSTGYHYNIVGSSAGATGNSPLSIVYTLDLSLIPANATIYQADVAYSLSGPTALSINVVDDGGSGSHDVQWDAEGIAKLNLALADGLSTYTVHATGTFTIPPPPGPRTFGVRNFSVWWKNAIWS